MKPPQILSSRPSGLGWVGVYALVLAVVLLPYLALSLNLQINRDSGVFLYGGWIISQGGMPYTEAWDHKGPLLYLLNALGFMLLNHPGAVMMLEGGLLSLALLGSVRLWLPLLHAWQAAVVVGLFMLSYLVCFEGGNLSETWMLPAQLLTYSLALRFFWQQSPRLLYPLCALLGLAATLALFTRINNGVGIFLVAVYLVFFNSGSWIKKTGVIAGAFVLSSLPVLVWLSHNEALTAFFEQYFSFNFSYAGEGDWQRSLSSNFKMTRSLLLSGIGLGLIASFILYRHSNGLQNRPDITRLLVVFGVVFAGDLAAQMLSGRGYMHYATISLSALTICLVLALHRLRGERVTISWHKHRFGYGVLVLVFMILSVKQLKKAVRPVLNSYDRGVLVEGTTANQLASYLSDHTSPDQPVAVHGAESWLLVASLRRSASYLTYYYPALVDFADTRAEYTADIIRQAPVYIVEAAESCGLSREKCQDPTLFSELASFIEQNYQLEASLHDYRFWRLSRSTAAPVQ